MVGVAVFSRVCFRIDRICFCIKNNFVIWILKDSFKIHFVMYAIFEVSC